MGKNVKLPEGTTENVRLKVMRKKMGHTQKEFADILGIKQGSYSDIERGKVGISGNLLKVLINKYRINPLWLYDGKGEIFFKDRGLNDDEEEDYFEEDDDVMEGCGVCDDLLVKIEETTRTIVANHHEIERLKVEVGRLLRS